MHAAPLCGPVFSKSHILMYRFVVSGVSNALPRRFFLLLLIIKT